jgi:hypothetical protein
LNQAVTTFRFAVALMHIWGSFLKGYVVGAGPCPKLVSAGKFLVCANFANFHAPVTLQISEDSNERGTGFVRRGKDKFGMAGLVDHDEVLCAAILSGKIVCAGAINKERFAWLKPIL